MSGEGSLPWVSARVMVMVGLGLEWQCLGTGPWHFHPLGIQTGNVCIPYPFVGKIKEN